MIKKIKLFLFFALLIMGEQTHAHNSIYILLTHPRATGTAFEKVMRTQENIKVLHAPFINPHLVKKYGHGHPFTLPLPDPTVTFDDVKNQLFNLANTSPVFLKDSAYLLLDYLREHPEFYKNPQVKIALFVRDPAKSILSFYKKMPTVNESIVGHRQLWEAFELLNAELGEAPLVIDSDEFLKNPLKILNKLGKTWDLEFNESNLKWEEGYAEDWHLKEWYVEVATSTGLNLNSGDVPRMEDGTPLYIEITDEVARAHMQDLYRSQNVYYQKLLEHAM